MRFTEQGRVMIVWAVADRFLDIVGLGTLIYWTVKGTLWVTRSGRHKR